MRRKSSFVLVGIGLLVLLGLAASFLAEDPAPGEPDTARQPITAPTAPETPKPTATVDPSGEAVPDEQQDDEQEDARPESLPPPAEKTAPEEEPVRAALAPTTPSTSPEESKGPFTGRVLDEAGKGVVGAKVTLLTWNEERLKGFPEGMRAMVLAQMKSRGMNQVVHMLHGVETTETKKGGTFSLERRLPGKVEHWLQIGHPAHVNVISTEFRSTPSRLEVTLPRGGTVEVTVQAPGGGRVKTPIVSMQPDLKEAVKVRATPLAFEYDTSGMAYSKEWKGVPNVTAGHHPTAPRALKARAKKRAAAPAPPKPRRKVPAKPKPAKPVGARVAAGTRPAPAVAARPPTQTAIFRSVPPGRHTVSASGDGLKTTSAPVDVRPGETAEITVALQAGKVLKGVVVDGAGNPLADAQVWAWRQGANQKHPRSTQAKTDAEGAFAIAGLDDAAVYRFNASCSGYQQTRWDVTGTPGKEQPVKIVLSRTFKASGRVVIEPGEERAGAGIQLKVSRTGGRQWNRSRGGKTLDGGTFELGGLLPGRYHLTAEGNGLTSLDPLPFVIAKDDVTDLLVKVRQGAKANLVVVERTGRGVPGAKVTVHTGAEDAMASYRSSRNSGEGKVTDEDGKLSLDGLAPGEYSVKVTHEGHAPGKATLVVDEGQEPAELRIVLVAEATLVCRILQADGAPYASKPVVIIPRDVSHLTPAAFQNMVSTDGEGRFTKRGLTAGRYRLQAMGFDKEFGGMRLVGEVRIAAGQESRVELRLKAATARVTGRVLRGTRPRAGVRVMVYQEGDVLAGFAQASTDSQGVFRTTGLAPGKYVVSTSGANKQTVELKEGSAPDVTLVIQAGTVAGRVMKPDGSPAPNALLYLRRLDDASLEDTFRTQVTADELGAFKVDKVRPGRYRLLAIAPGVGSSKGVELQMTPDEARTGLDLPLTAGGILKVSVTRADGQPAVGTRIDYYHMGLKVFGQQLSGWGGSSSTTDRHGKALLKELIPGTYVVFARSASNQMAVAEGVRIGEGAQVTRKLTLVPGGTLQVTGPPNTQLTIHLAASSSPLAGTAMPWVTLFGLSKTDAEGRLTLRNLPPVDLEVRGKTADGRDTGRWRGRVPSNGTAQAVLR